MAEVQLGFMQNIDSEQSRNINSTGSSGEPAIESNPLAVRTPSRLGYIDDQGNRVNTITSVGDVLGQPPY